MEGDFNERREGGAKIVEVKLHEILLPSLVQHLGGTTRLNWAQTQPNLEPVEDWLDR